MADSTERVCDDVCEPSDTKIGNNNTSKTKIDHDKKNKVTARDSSLSKK